MMHDVADALAALLAGVDVALLRIAGDLREDLSSSLFVEQLVQHAMAGSYAVDPCDPHGPAAPDDQEWSPERRRYAHVIALDRALRTVLTPSGLAIPPGLDAVAERYRERGWLTESVDHGGLLPSAARPSRRSDGPEQPAELLSDELVYLPAEQAQRVRIVLLDPDRALPHTGAAPLRVACVPFLGHPDDVRVEHVPRRRRRAAYRITPVDERLLPRVRPLLAALDRARVHMALLPEYACSPSLLRAWREALADPGRPRSPLRLVIPGSGWLDRPAGGAPDNTVPVLDGQDGRVIASQSKLHGFPMSASEVKSWRLGLPHEELDEDISIGEHLTALEWEGGRAVVLPCEDLARIGALAARVTALRPSHMIVPVFSRPLKRERWEQRYGRGYVEQAGSQVLIVNSLVVGRAQSGGSEPLGAAIAISPWANPGADCFASAQAGDDIVVFELLDGGAAHIAALATR